MAEYTSGGDKVQMCYPFEMLQPARLTAPLVQETFERLAQAAPDAWPCWAFSNHDVIRHRSRWGLTDAGQRAYMTMLCCLRGSICLYQGEELGLPEADLAFDDLVDPYGIEFWPEFKGRDGCRTPMVWEASNTNGGFSDARPWLPVPPEHLALAVAHQAADGASMLAHYRAVLAFRRAHPALRGGSMTAPVAHGPVAQFERRQGDARYLCAFNLSDEAAPAQVPQGTWAALGDNLGCVTSVQAGQVMLAPWQTLIATAA
jgi:alpha-glucosidase